MKIQKEADFFKLARKDEFHNCIIVADEKTLRERKWEPKTLVVVPAALQFVAAELFDKNDLGIQFFVSRAIIPVYQEPK